jgi:hypothetical protein
MNVNADLLALGRHAVTGRVTPLLGRRTVTRLARIMVQPVDRAPDAPTMIELIGRALLGFLAKRLQPLRSSGSRYTIKAVLHDCGFGLPPSPMISACHADLRRGVRGS